MKREKDITITISNILKAGVYFSSFLILVGIILTFVSDTSGNLTIERYTFQEMITGLFKFDNYSYLMFGIFVLIPVLRILGLLVIYLKEKDYKFVRICIIVLLILCISLTLGVTHN